jgi:hypothetical protein
VRDPLRRYGKAEIERFLEEVNAGLERPAEVIVIGWAAAIRGYDAPGRTQDIDTETTVSKALESAIARARQATGLSLPFGKAGVSDAPYEFESRLIRVVPHLERLIVLVPEKHDLALMKVVRGHDRDIEALRALHERSPLDCDVLVRLWREEMGQAIGEPRRLRDNFLALIESLFPERLPEIERRLLV